MCKKKLVRVIVILSKYALLSAEVFPQISREFLLYSKTRLGLRATSIRVRVSLMCVCVLYIIIIINNYYV